MGFNSALKGLNEGKLCITVYAVKTSTGCYKKIMRSLWSQREFLPETMADWRVKFESWSEDSEPRQCICVWNMS